MQSVLRGLFECEIGIGLTNPAAPQPPLWPAEQAYIAQAIPTRQNEFAAGRAAARRALRDIGQLPQAIPAQDNRAPVWPAGVAGSITHSKTICAAVVSPHATALGLDIEPLQVMDEDLISSICSKKEISHILSLDKCFGPLLVFAAKEAAYKAQFPLTETLFGFDALDVVLNPETKSFTATFLHRVGGFAVGDRLPGRYGFAAGHLVSGVTIGQVTAKGA